MFKTFPALAALALALALSGTALAQLNTANDTEATSAILGAGKYAVQIRSLRHVPSVGVISLQATPASPFSELGDEIDDLHIYAERNAAGVNRLRQALAANPVTRRALAEHGVNIGDVLGVQIGASGSLRVFEN